MVLIDMDGDLKSHPCVREMRSDTEGWSANPLHLDELHAGGRVVVSRRELKVTVQDRSSGGIIMLFGQYHAQHMVDLRERVGRIQSFAFPCAYCRPQSTYSDGC
jgi:hypothetical protein